MHPSSPVENSSWRVRAAMVGILFALLMGIGGMQATTPVGAQTGQVPSDRTGLRGITQAPHIGTAYVDAPRDYPDILYIATLPRSADGQSVVLDATATRVPLR